jgi:hypothetical protein
MKNNLNRVDIIAKGSFISAGFCYPAIHFAMDIMVMLMLILQKILKPTWMVILRRCGIAEGKQQKRNR